MTREIKFRAWDKAEKVMINQALQVANIGFGEGTLLLHSDTEKGNELIWLQFTGLIDKSGTEIYEGDIIKSESGRNTCIVEWGLLNASLKGFPKGIDGLEMHGWIVRNVYFSQIIDALDASMYEGEVIGNIYQNANLLTQEK